MRHFLRISVSAVILVQFILGLFSPPAKAQGNTLAAMPVTPQLARSVTQQVPTESGWIAYLLPDGNVGLVSPDASMSLQLTQDAQAHTVVYSNLLWSLDGHYLGIKRLLEREDKVDFLVYDSHTQKTLTIASGFSGQDFWEYAWLPDHRSIAFASASKIGVLFDPYLPGLGRLWMDGQTGVFVPSTQEHYRFSNLKTSPDGNWLLFVVPSFERMATNTGLIDLNNPTAITNFNRMGIADCIWAADSSALTCIEDQQVVVLDLQGNRVKSLPQPDGAVYHSPVAYSPDGSYLAFHTMFSTFSDRKEMTILDENGDYPYQGEGLPTSWSPDGNQLLVTDLDQIHILDRNGWQKSALTPGSQGIWQPGRVQTPDAITDLYVIVARYETEINQPGAPLTITLTVPDGLSMGGAPVTELEVRFNTEPITNDNWVNSNVILKVEDNLQPGTSLTKKVFLPPDFFSRQLYFTSRSKNTLSPWSSLSNQVKLIDTGFRADKNGYYFDNGDPTWPAKLDSFFTTNDMRDLFGDDVCIPRLSTSDYCYLWGIYWDWYQTVLELSTGGHCLGMSVSSQMLYYDPSTYNIFPTQDTLVYSKDVNLQNFQPGNFIIKNHVKQFASPVRNYKYINWGGMDVNFVLDGLTYRLLRNMGGDLEIDNGLGVWHSITPIALVENADGLKNIVVYDNNSHGQHNELRINPTNKAWGYYSSSGSLIIANDNSKLLLIPLDLFTGTQKLTADDLLTILLQGNIGDIRSFAKDATGKVTGWFEGIASIEIPGSAIIPLSVDADSTQLGYYLPTGQDYTFYLEPTLDGTSGTVFLSGFSEKSSFVMDNVTVNADTKDAITLGWSENRITYQPNIPQEISWSFSMLAEEAQGFSVRLNHFKIDPGAQAVIEWDENQESLIVTTGGESSYSIEIQRRSASQADVFSSTQVQMKPGQSHIYNLATWDGTGKMTVQIDTDQDGAANRSIKLKNEAGLSQASPGIMSTSRIIGVIMLVTGLALIMYSSIRLKKILS